MHFPSLGLLSAPYPGAPENLFSLHSARTSPLYHTLSSCISLTMWTFLRAQHRFSSLFLYSGISSPPWPLSLPLSPLGDYGGAERAPSSHGLPNPWTCGDLDRSEQRGGVPFLSSPIAILSLYSTLFETCTWGGYWVRECYSSTSEVFFVYVGLTPVCGEDRSSCELQNALCRRVSPVRTSFSGGPYMGLIS